MVQVLDDEVYGGLTYADVLWDTDVYGEWTDEGDALPAQVAVGTGSALNAGPSVSASAEVASGTGDALDATGSVADVVVVDAGVATGAGDALEATTDVAASIDVASGVGGALNASVSTSKSVDAEVASGTGAARDVAAAGKVVFAQVASGTGVARDATAYGGTESPTAGVASGTGVARDPQASKRVLIPIQAALGVGAARNPSVVASSAQPVIAGVAAGAGAAYNAQVATRTTDVQAPLTSVGGPGSAPRYLGGSSAIHVIADLAQADVVVPRPFDVPRYYGELPAIQVTNRSPSGMNMATGVLGPPSTVPIYRGRSRAIHVFGPSDDGGLVDYCPPSTMGVGGYIDTFNRVLTGEWGGDWIDQGHSEYNELSSTQLSVSDGWARIVATVDKEATAFQFGVSRLMALPLPQLYDLDEFVIAFEAAVGFQNNFQRVAYLQIQIGDFDGGFPMLDFPIQFEQFSFATDQLDFFLARDYLGFAPLPGAEQGLYRYVEGGEPFYLGVSSANIALTSSFDGTILIDRSLARGDTRITVGGYGTFIFKPIWAAASIPSPYLRIGVSDGHHENALAVSTFSIANVRLFNPGQRISSCDPYQGFCDWYVFDDYRTDIGRGQGLVSNEINNQMGFSDGYPKVLMYASGGGDWEIHDSILSVQTQPDNFGYYAQYPNDAQTLIPFLPWRGDVYETEWRFRFNVNALTTYDGTPNEGGQSSALWVEFGNQPVASSKVDVFEVEPALPDPDGFAGGMDLRTFNGSGWTTEFLWFLDPSSPYVGDPGFKQVVGVWENDAWYHVKMKKDATFKLQAKIWKEGTTEPEWQIEVQSADYNLERLAMSLQSVDTSIFGDRWEVDWIKFYDNCAGFYWERPETAGVIFRNQIGDPTTTLDRTVCLLESAAMVLDWHTHNQIQVWGGQLVPWCGRSESSIREFGTSLENAQQAWRHWGQYLDIRTGEPWEALMAHLAAGKAAILGGEYVELQLCDDFTGGHAIAVFPYFNGDRILVGDPLCNDFKYVTQTALRDFAEAQGVAFFGDPDKLYFAVSRSWT